ncbi:LacI family DNA-binding transcriptional regulator [Paenibacillus sp. MER 99-2]|uniref:LacI family DNA-binding transcriptional regulator n=1 Tax=Paenibacillus sp. MER 99-2 TaxID=2939572 RepID=UPI00203E6ABF|nr:LacI family DNA-binding transcriptional regulator [Paenibacillus sp. MER 99-2]MCM3173763.1 LacI family transcriptional regulator [Paenibacillus sp. MER 99-2]
MITIKDIAKLAGVSYSTVSKALNGDPRIKPATRQKVLAVAEKHQYRKNIMAQQLSTGRSNIIGFVLDELSNPLFSNISGNLHAELKKRGYQMILVVADDGVDIFSQLRVDGCILWDYALEDREAFWKKFATLNMPCFVLGTDEAPNSPYIKIDRKEGIYKAVQHLQSLGHSRIGFIGNSQNIKLEGYREALQRTGLEFEPHYVLPAHSSWEDGYFAIRNYSFGSESPTAFIGLNNLVTRGALRALLEAGYNVPKDISLIGYDDLPDMQYAEVALTTIGPPLEELAAQAAELIVSLIRGEQREYPVVIQPQLNHRSSTAVSRKRLPEHQ